MSTSTQEGKTHIGHNNKKLREMLDIKQETLAKGLGTEWTQKKISRLEDRPEVEDELLQQVAEIFKVPVEVIKNYDADKAVNVISNTFNADNYSVAVAYSENTNINSVDKLMEAVEENRTIAQKNTELYERLLATEREKVELLERLLKEQK